MEEDDYTPKGGKIRLLMTGGVHSWAHLEHRSGFHSVHSWRAQRNSLI